jgi:hypothetical protein
VSDALESLARRVMRDPFFLAAPLARYAASHRLDDDALAARLGCPRAALTDLRLCLNPHPEPPRFGQDVERIAAEFGLDPGRLAEVVRFGQALLQLSPPPEADACRAEDVPGYLMAAREDELPPDPGGES